MNSRISTERSIAMLSTIKEFHALSDADLEAIAQIGSWHRYEVGEEVVRYRDKSNSVFFIVQGEMRVTYYSLSGHEVILCGLPAGEMFGELTAIDGEPRSATVVAKSRSLLMSISSSDFHSLILSNQSVALAIFNRLTCQVRRLTERIFEFSTLAVRNRIHAELLRLARRQIIASNIATISPAPTHADIANLVSTHREAVTRELNELHRNRLIIRIGNNLHIPDLSKLIDLVNAARDSGSQVLPATYVGCSSCRVP